MKTYILFLSIFFLSSVNTIANVFNFDLPEPRNDQIEELNLWATNYYIWRAEEIDSGAPLYGTNNQPITGNISNYDWCMGAREGTILFVAKDKSKTIYNIADKHGSYQINCLEVIKTEGFRNAWSDESKFIRYSIARGPYGDGVNGNSLVPFRSIAVDPKVINFGAIIFIPEAKGTSIKLPTGVTAKHDGYFFAADTGHAIKGNKIDIFLGMKQKNPFQSLHFSSENKLFKAYVVKDNKLVQYFKSIHQN